MTQSQGAETKPWFRTAASLDPSIRTCTCCERDLSGHAVRMLEYDQRTQTFHDLPDVPADQSQGWFPFGLTCAEKLVRTENERRAALKTGGE